MRLLDSTAVRSGSSRRPRGLLFAACASLHLSAVTLFSQAPVPASGGTDRTPPPARGEASYAERAGDSALAELNFADARQWFEKAARGGSAYSQWRLGELLKEGTPAIPERSTAVAADPVAAVRWFFKAARQGHSRAFLELGRCYETGAGVARDPIEAYKWHALARDNREAAAAPFLEALAGELTTEEKEEAEKRAAFFTGGRQRVPAGLPEEPVADQIVLRGISGPKGRRLALINNESFSQGETRELLINERPVKVTCLDIGEQSAMIRIEEEKEAKVLSLPR